MFEILFLFGSTPGTTPCSPGYKGAEEIVVELITSDGTTKWRAGRNKTANTYVIEIPI